MGKAVCARQCDNKEENPAAMFQYWRKSYKVKGLFHMKTFRKRDDAQRANSAVGVVWC